MRILLAAFIVSSIITLLLFAGVVISAYAEDVSLVQEIGGILPVGDSAHGSAPQSTPMPPGVVTATVPITTPAASLPLLTPSIPLTVTISVTTTLTPTPTQDTWWSFMPIVSRQTTPTPPPPEPRKLLVCASPDLPIPDNSPTGKTTYITINDPGQVVDVRAYVRINHTWVGDVTARVEHEGLISKLFDRPGVPDPSDGSQGCGSDNVRAIFDDGMASAAESKCFTTYPAIGGSFRPTQPLSVFFDQPAGGSWGLRVVDENLGDTGTLVEWCLDMTVLDGTPTPAPIPEPVNLPSSASIGGMSGQPQMYVLDCESRSAVDWARHWGKVISEYEFFWGLPRSLNPELGFVGDANGTWGLVPPDDYGVHAGPIAARLRAYGLNAQARKYMRWDDLRAEIAAGRPVIVWILGTIWTGAPRYYRPADGPYTVTAPWEHTMVLVGYSADAVWLLNGSTISAWPLEAFLDSWSALANMGVVYQP